MKPFIRSILLFAALIVLSSCICISESRKQDYGLLKSAVMFSADKVIGEFGDQIPAEFSGEAFMELVKDKIPANYYSALKPYELKIKPDGYYYRLELFDGDEMVLFDFSCTPGIDGAVKSEDKTFNLDNLEAYNPCN